MTVKHQACMLVAALLCATPLLADGGDTCADATVITSIPFTDTGNTSTFAVDYDEVCPYTGVASPDVVYVYSPPEDVCVYMFLCDGSAYDTKLYVYENVCQDPNDGQDPFACSDDACTSPNYPGVFASQLVGLQLLAGNDYYIVVDGYDGGAGDYVLDIIPCPIGACCVDYVCVETNTFVECDALGGEWFEGEACPDLTCPGPCPEDTLEIVIYTDGYPHETTWELHEQGGGLIASAGPLELASYTHTWRVCLEAANCYDFAILDSFGDGLGEDSWYELYLNETLVGYGGYFETSDTTQVGSSCPPCPEETLEVLISTDDYPWETTWEVQEVDGPVIATGGPMSQPQTLYTRSVCLDADRCYRFTIYDSYADGICCDYGPGWYEVYYGGVQVWSGAQFGSSETSPPFGDACGDATVLIDIYTDGFGEETTWQFADRNSGAILASGGPYTPYTLYQIPIPVDSAGCYDFTIYDEFGDGICCWEGNGYYDVYFEDQLVCTGGEFGYEETCADVTGAGNCLETDAVILVEILTDTYGSETTWEIVERSSGVPVALGGPYSDVTLYQIEVGVYSTLCYDFTIYDAYGDGICCGYGEGYYNVYYNGGLICSGAEFGDSETCPDLGDGCTDCPNPGSSGDYCTADILNADCLVNLADLAQLLGNYGITSGGTHEDGDLDGDGDVDLADLAALLGQYGDDCN